MKTYVEQEKDDQLCKNLNCKALNLSSSHPGCLLNIVERISVSALAAEIVFRSHSATPQQLAPN